MVFSVVPYVGQHRSLGRQTPASVYGLQNILDRPREVSRIETGARHPYEELKAFCEVTGIKAIAL